MILSRGLTGGCDDNGSCNYDEDDRVSYGDSNDVKCTTVRINGSGVLLTIMKITSIVN